ncbi:S8 family serine peptidase [Sphingomonas sp.]|jgi:subtilisin family serine protease|uniref:S8 family serine peptidase n=1 Tax=Sphingomonas sp. TaxID=28214 RepID=UPI002E3393EE|nr:S8 family serine peptidase [Sphingomonas sp.]HEX4695238.1 S8 family serine peptidase [Sphingomonas sp.]
MNKFATLLVVAVLAGLAVFGAAVAQRTGKTGLAPILRVEGKVVPDQYIVVFKKGVARAVTSATRERVKALGGTILHEYRTALNGFSVRISPKGLKELRADPSIDYIEPDQLNELTTIQLNPVPGLDRTSERLLPLDHRYTYSETGAGVNVYIVDTGIRATNVEFGGRVSGGVTEIMDGNGTNDCHGHGTNVAGIVGGGTYGVAKNVALHPVRVFTCAGGGATTSVLVAGVDWITANAVHPAVANMSLRGPVQPALDTAINNSITSGVTYVVAAGNDSGADACTFSPAHVANAITVGAIDPGSDVQAGFSNIGTCLDLYAPGVNIQAAGNGSDTATSTFSGTSQASPHVAGTAAKFLQLNPLATPAQVWAAIHAADDLNPGTSGWSGIGSRGAGSPNELLHWGSLSTGQNDGDPHITTVDGVPYDFQAAGEFVALRDGSLELQTRQTPVPTGAIVYNAHTGLSSCVSVNTAAAMRVGGNRVTYQPNPSAQSNASGMQVRVNGVLTPVPAGGFGLPGGGRLSPAGGGLLVDTPDGSTITLLPNFWGAPHNIWYLSIAVINTRASDGIMGAIAADSWLPRLANGGSLGPLPAAPPQRYADLYGKFANSWRVTNATTLFDYAAGASTGSFTVKSWPPQTGACVINKTPVVPKTLDISIARKVCLPIRDEKQQANCIADVVATADTGFARAYLNSERVAAAVAKRSPLMVRRPTTKSRMIRRTR